MSENQIKPYGWHLLIEPYNYGDNFIATDGQKSIFERPDSAKDRDLTQLGVGKIIAIGSSAFHGPQFTNWETLPKVDEYIAYPKYEGVPIKYNGVDYIGLKDYLVMFYVPDPSLYGYYNFTGN